jgi:hypothetical protein
MVGGLPSQQVTIKNLRLRIQQDGRFWVYSDRKRRDILAKRRQTMSKRH